MELEQLTKDLVNGLLIAGLTLLGLVAVHLTAKRVLGWVKSVQNIRDARRQQLVTLVLIVRWALDITLVASAVLMLLSPCRTSVMHGASNWLPWSSSSAGH